MTADQRRRSAAQLATLEAQTRHTTQIAAAHGALGLIDAPVMTLADLLALDVEARKAAWLTLDHSTKVAIAIERLTERDIFFDRVDIAMFIAGLDAKAEATAVEAPALAHAAMEIAPYFADDRTSTGLAAGAHDLDDRTVEAAYSLARARHELLSTRWQNALRKAFDHLYEDGFRVGIRADGAYFWHPDDSDGGMYAVQPNACQCRAFESGWPCKHRAAAIILSFYTEAATA